MLKRIQRILCTPEFYCWLVACIALTWQLAPILGNGLVAGWDISSHYYLTTRMLANLKNGGFSVYDPLWNAGYPEFVLYPPGTFVLIALAQMLGAGAASPAAIFNFVLFLLPFSYLIAFVCAAQSFFGAAARPAAIIVAILTLFIPNEFAYFGMGLPGLLYLGLVPGFTGAVFFLFFLGSLARLEERSFIRAVTASGLLLAAIILTHSLTFLFAIIAVVFYIIISFTRTAFLRLFFALAVALLLTVWWTAPFLSNLWLSASDSRGFDRSTPDAAFAVYIFKWFRDGGFFPVLSRGSLELAVPFSGVNFTIPALLVYFPHAALVLFVFGAAGYLSLAKRGRLFLPVLFSFTFLLLPRNILNIFFSAGIHYFRFAFYIMLINALLAVFGMTRLFEIMRGGKRLVRWTLRPVAAAFFGAALILVPFMQYRGYFTIVHWQGTNHPTFFSPKLVDYPLYGKAGALVKRLCAMKPAGRIAVEDSVYLVGSLGTPHFFSSLLPLECELPVIPGLLTESSASAGFTVSTLGIGSKEYPWGRTALFLDPGFRRLSFPQLTGRLALFNTAYILTTSKKYFTNLKVRARRNAKLLFRSGPFAVFKLKSPAPLAESPRHPPVLYVDAGGPPFREFSEAWFKDLSLTPYRIIYTTTPFAEIPAAERERLGGIILSARSGDVADCGALDSLSEDKLRIVLNASRCANDAPAGVVFAGDFSKSAGWDVISRALKRVPAAPRWKRPSVKLENERTLSIHSDSPVLLNFSFAAGWRSRLSDQIVYMATPAQLFIFGRGHNTLNYR